jgi:DeoR family glycerol-3-phosphate regulon repressor
LNGSFAPSIIATDHSKFGRAALIKVSGFSDFDLLVSDRPPPQDLALALKAADARWEVAGE